MSESDKADTPEFLTSEQPAGQSTEELAPILLRGDLHETIWGGQRLTAFAGKMIAEGMTVGESWETANESVALNPPYAGQSLGALVEALDERLIGWRAAEVFGHRFPLLTKFIDAQQWLSVQVHPDDRYAAEYEGGKLGKTETWYILHAEPGAKLVFGLAREASQQEVREAIAANRLEELLYTFEAHAGDVIFVPAGTVHAIGAGIVLYELQEYSDVTYRMYDYGRLQADGTPRELHVERSLDVMRCGPAEATRVNPVVAPDARLDGERRVLVACEYFVEEELRFHGAYAAATTGASCHIISILDGACNLTVGETTLALGLGNTAVIPAALGEYHLQSRDTARLLCSYVPTRDDQDLSLWRNSQPHAG
jgi:mannose-6-phosphate isomerase